MAVRKHRCVRVVKAIQPLGSCIIFGQNGDSSGFITDAPTCPKANATLDFTARFKNDNLLLH